VGKQYFFQLVTGLVLMGLLSCTHTPPALLVEGEILTPADDLVHENLTRHLTVLTKDIGSRSIYEIEKLRAAEEYIQGEFTDMGLTVRRQEYEASGRSTANIIARSVWFNTSRPAIVLGAHYDTVPGTPGADDNASAVAVLLETARSMVSRSPDRLENIIFAAFSTEEPPSFGTHQMGSRMFADSLGCLGYQVEGAVILEMVGYYDHRPGTQMIPTGVDLSGIGDAGDFLAIVADGQSKELAEKVLAGYRKSESRLKALSMVFPEPEGEIASLIRLSDHASFWDAGIPAVMVTDTAFLRNRNYHQRSDRMSTLSIPAMENVVIGLASAMYAIVEDKKTEMEE
jgi:Zn-dependent M28 family amino/carboxypeptidase